ncbi:TRAP transporter substrate-binding protein DctP [Buttiauxella selenatireducens]|uniref:TRAP transporter substrate-binding protein DctP n=1 Tax=Buttiauxella selenatireducens TaxID=3073902 RepID=A0ABY9S6Y4_9ENTR|nr:TRAP transporter substrate-binding protein DctP [Buttiauxella sp. R73]WMY73276.1 TRAP transporter substrate-binding protein DctP [Buttiauxella sp. R73]
MQSGKMLAIALSALLIPTTVSAAQILKYSDHEPLGGMRTRFIKDVFFAEIEKESQGRLKIEEHWDSELARSYDALGAVKEGKVADIATVVPEYTPKEFPLQQIFKSFPTGPTGDQQVEFFRKAYATIPEFQAELTKQNVVNIFLATGYPVAFFSTKPLNHLDDIKGTQWRSASFWHQDFLKNSGAIPVSMPWGDAIYDALKAGRLDGLMVNVDSGYQLNVHKTAPNILISKDLWLGHVYPLVMNKNTWDKLAEEDKQAIQRAAAKAYQSLGSVMDSGYDAMIKDLRNNGANVRELTSNEVAQWENTTHYQQVQEKWLKEQESQGVKDVRPTMQKVTVLLKDTLLKETMK